MTSNEGGAPRRTCGNCVHRKTAHCKGKLAYYTCALSAVRVSSLLAACDRWQISLEWGPYVKEKT